MKKLGALLTLAVTAVVAGPAASYGQVGTTGLPVYRPVSSLKGDLHLVGSNTMSHVATVWADSFRRFYPDVNITIDVDGSREAVGSVADGQASMGLLSRTITQEEIEYFTAKKGHAPKVLTPCMERIAISVHKENPIRGLTLRQLDGIFSTTLKRGEEKPIRTWGQLGFPGAWAEQPIIARGRSTDTGAQVYFQEAVLLSGEFRDDLASDPGSLDLVKAIGADPRSIGFSGLSYNIPDVRPVPLALRPEGPYIAIDSEEADAGQYPLVRPLQFVVSHRPGQEMPAVEREFIRYVFSELGQEDVIKAGFQAIPAQPAHVALDSVGLGVAR